MLALALRVLLLAARARLAAPSWMYLGLTGVPPPLPQDSEKGAGSEDPGVAEARAVCGSLPGLVPQQVNTCMRSPDSLRSVAEGARRGIEECQYQFMHERWNCTAHADDQSVFGYVLQRGSRETAFVYAVTSAGVAHAVTQACSSGNLTECSCDSSRHGRTTAEGWKWGGCSDNLHYGLQFSRRFVNAPEVVSLLSQPKKIMQVRLQMNLHNNEVGRQVISSLMKKQCRCHGISGSCELKTCWKTIPTFYEIGDILKMKYNHAVLVSRKVAARKLKQFKLRRKVRLPASRGDLVHIQRSPDYCRQDAPRGIPGTAGRVCNASASAARPDNCARLCCGRGHHTQVVKLIKRCHCKFIWCCHVKCKICESNIDLHTCK
ncbi:protein Wnt-16-like [Bacillus rossius redtenbacheri]|uniref:protein Wnt-16-like n=1 Tax=Bacillus rossius redtenbacheri TaxID=93214 RepID=UPI002FDD501D